MILFKVINNNFIDTWQDYSKTSSFRVGARWNHQGIPTMYTSKNVQNAMLEIANYVKSPALANKRFSIAVFEFPELSLKVIEPEALPKVWYHRKHKVSVKNAGSKYLSDKRYHGIVVPTSTINAKIATHTINAVRESVYANVVVNLAHIGVSNIKRLDIVKPIYSDAMFD